MVKPAALPNPWVIAVTVMFATFMEVLDTSVANVALPHIAGNLSSTTEEATWVLTAYLVAKRHRAADERLVFQHLFGRKRFYMWCVLLFTVSSALCGLAPSPQPAGPVPHSAGASAAVPCSQSRRRSCARVFRRQAGYGDGDVRHGSGVCAVIGPTLGGWITDNYSWHWIFLINIPVGILSIFLSSMLVHDPPFRSDRACGMARASTTWVGTAGHRTRRTRNHAR